jgi:thioredoxin-like negative regulator of GroEL
MTHNQSKTYARFDSLGPSKKAQQKELEDNNVPSCVVISSMEQRKQILDSYPIVCIYLNAVWCAPCKVAGPIFNKLALQYSIPYKCLLVKEDVDLELTRDFKITGVPAFIFYANGIPVKKTRDGPNLIITGAEFSEVEEILQKLIGTGTGNQTGNQEQKNNTRPSGFPSQVRGNGVNGNQKGGQGIPGYKSQSQNPIDR